jgi:hypothetical protein
MKAFLLAVAVLALVIAAYLSPALAQTAKPSNGNNSPVLARNLGTGARTDGMTTMHYEYRSGYEHHGGWRGHWSLVPE